MNQRERTSTEQAYRNAAVAQREISAGNTNGNAILEQLQQVGVTQAAINVNGDWASTSAKIDVRRDPCGDATACPRRPRAVAE